MKLVIVESPAKAKTISSYLGDEYDVIASVGHIRDLPKSNKKAIDFDEGFMPHYEIVQGKEHIVTQMRGLARKADEVLLATDPDREGEAIAWHIAEAIGLENPKRIVFHEITKEAIIEAVKTPRKIDENLRKAQEARRVLDRLFGYDLSGLIWRKLRYGLSAGRVQSPALRILMEREREIRAFKPETYFILSADVENDKKIAFTLTCSQEPKDQASVDSIIEAAKKGLWSVADIKETNVTQKPKAPFITSTLQQAASSRLGYSPSNTMRIAQKLYEKGHITYMRTDSTMLAKSAQEHIVATIEKEYGKKYVHANIFKSKSKNAQEAHEAIRPTNISKKTAGVTSDQKKLYELIRSRTLASQMSPAETLRAKLIVEIDEEAVPDFHVNGSRVLFDGWMIADPAAKREDVQLPEVQKGEKLFLKDINSEEKQTTPPNRYSEAGLVKELEKRGIGRPSTYASIMRTLVDRGYVEKEGKTLIPTDTGDVVDSFLVTHFKTYISDTFTAEMEQELDDISNGKREYTKTLADFYGPFKKQVASKEDLEKITNLGKADAKYKCPVCKKKMVIKLGKTGKFLSCANFPDCIGARTIEGNELAQPKEIGEDCPKCKEKSPKGKQGKLIEREGRFGMFVACNNYPKCKFVKDTAVTDESKKTGVTCPTCNKGEMIERTGRFGIFYSCSDYPDCKYAIKAKPTGNICPMCKSLMMEGTKTIPERCSVKTCPNHNPHKLDK